MDTPGTDITSPGTRVRLICEQELGRNVYLEAGVLGTVEIADADNCMVRLDRPIPDGEEPADEFWIGGGTIDYTDARDGLRSIFAPADEQ